MKNRKGGGGCALCASTTIHLPAYVLCVYFCCCCCLFVFSAFSLCCMSALCTSAHVKCEYSWTVSESQTLEKYEKKQEKKEQGKRERRRPRTREYYNLAFAVWCFVFLSVHVHAHEQKIRSLAHQLLHIIFRAEVIPHRIYIFSLCDACIATAQKGITNLTRITDERFLPDWFS